MTWVKWQHYFESDEFQNRGTIHVHSFAYTEVKVEELISLNTICADVPNPITGKNHMISHEISSARLC